MVQSITQGKNGLHDPLQLDRAPDLIKHVIENGIRDENVQRNIFTGRS